MDFFNDNGYALLFSVYSNESRINFTVSCKSQAAIVIARCVGIISILISCTPTTTVRILRIVCKLGIAQLFVACMYMQQKIHTYIYAGKYNIRSSLPEPTYRKGTTHNKKRETRPRLNFLLLKRGAGYHPLLPVKRLPNFLRVSSYYQHPFLSARFLAANIHLVLSTTTNYRHLMVLYA